MVEGSELTFQKLLFASPWPELLHVAAPNEKANREVFFTEHMATPSQRLG